MTPAPTLPSLDDVCREQYRRSYYRFFVDAYRVLHPGEAYLPNWHITELCGLLQAEVERIRARAPRAADLVCNTPFRSAKSLIFSVCLNAWAWAHWPQAKFICVSFSSPLALELAMRTRDLIQSDWYQRLYGHVFQLADDANTKGFFKTDKGGFRKSIGTGGQITGSGADIIVLDDPQDPARAASETERKATIDFYRHTLYSRLNDPALGVRVTVQQRLHEEDLTGYLLSQNPDAHRHVCIPAELTPGAHARPMEWACHYRDGLFWPERFGRGQLAEYRQALGSKQYANQLQQQPSPDGGTVFKREWFATRPAPAQATRTDFYLDTASTADQRNDATAIVAVQRVGETVHVVDATEVRLEMPELVRFIQAHVARLGNAGSKVHIEDKSSGIGLMQLLRQQTRLHVVPLKPGRESKLERASKAAVACESGRVVLAPGQWQDQLLDQLTAYPNARHDDLVDALAYAINTPPTGGLSYYF